MLLATITISFNHTRFTFQCVLNMILLPWSLNPNHAHMCLIRFNWATKLE